MKQISKFLAVGAISAMSLLGFSSCDKEYNPNDPGALVPLTVTEDASLPAINVNGTRLHSEAFGNPADPMIVFLHGGPGADYRNGMNIKNFVANHYYVVFYDQRGSGLSQRHPKSSFSIQVMIDDLTAVIAHYRSSPTQKIFLFGHSWGAMLATAYVNQYPTAINGVVMAEPGGFKWEQVKDYVKRSRRLKIFDEVTSDALYPDQFLSGNERDHQILDYKIALEYPYTYAKGNIEGIEGPSPFWRNGAAVVKKLFEIGDQQGFDFTSNLSHYNTPVLFLFSENNHAYGITHANQLAAAYPHAQVKQVNGTGHEMIYFGWNAVYSLALPYFEALR